MLANYLSGRDHAVDINRLPDFVYGDMRVEYYEHLSGKKASDLSWADINRLRPSVHRYIARARDGLVFVKTHNLLSSVEGVPTITPDATFGAIYVVRNPLDMVISFAKHYGLPIDRAAQAICFKGLDIPAKPGHIPQILSDWSSHVRGWLQASGLYLKVVRYEDLSANPLNTFGEVIDFLKFPRDPQRLKMAVKFSSFQELARQEKRNGFIERSKSAERFFNKGRVGVWRKILGEKEIRLITERHGEMMKELGYLAPDGRIRR